MILDNQLNLAILFYTFSCLKKQHVIILAHITRVEAPVKSIISSQEARVNGIIIMRAPGGNIHD